MLLHGVGSASSLRLHAFLLSRLESVFDAADLARLNLSLSD